MKISKLYMIAALLVLVACSDNPTEARSSSAVQVSSSNKQKLSGKTPALKQLSSFTGFRAPTAIAVDQAGNLYVSNWGNGTVSKADQSGMNRYQNIGEFLS